MKKDSIINDIGSSRLEDIVSTLNSQHIPCTYSEKDQLVYVFYEGVYGEVFSLYSYDQGRYINHTIYPYKVSENLRKEVEQKLSTMNCLNRSTQFYIDKGTHCIAFYRDCKLNQTDKQAEGLFIFCEETHRACINYQASLYALHTVGERNIFYEKETTG